jgi:MinD superfamily P-loop ATPase
LKFKNYEERKNKTGYYFWKRGVGKSMLCSALIMLFSQNKKVIALDCDADAPNLAIWLGGIKKMGQNFASYCFS